MSSSETGTMVPPPGEAGVDRCHILKSVAGQVSHTVGALDALGSVGL